MGLVNAACLVGSVVLAARRGGVGFALAVAIALPLSLLSLPPEAYSDVWNSSVGLAPLRAARSPPPELVLVRVRRPPALAAARGRRELRRAGAPDVRRARRGLVGAHGRARLPRPPPVAASRRNLGRGGGSSRRSASPPSAGPAPVLDEAIHRPGNLTLLVRSATSGAQQLGRSAGLRALAHGVGIVRWLAPAATRHAPARRRPQPRPGPRGGRVRRPRGRGARRSSGRRVALLAGLDPGPPRRSGSRCASPSPPTRSSTPRGGFATVGYVFRWVGPTGLCVWLLLVFSVHALLPRRTSRPRRRDRPSVHVHPRRRPRPAAVASGLAVSLRGGSPARALHAARAIADCLLARLPRDRPAQLEIAFSHWTFFLEAELQTAMVDAFRREGPHGGGPGADAGASARTTAAPSRGRGSCGSASTRHRRPASASPACPSRGPARALGPPRRRGDGLRLSAQRRRKSPRRGCGGGAGGAFGSAGPYTRSRMSAYRSSIWKRLRTCSASARDRPSWRIL